MRIDVELSKRSIDNAIREIEAYQKKVRQALVDMVTGLLNAGYRVAMINRGHWGNAIEIRRDNEQGNTFIATADATSFEAALIMSSEPTRVEWYSSKNKDGELKGMKSYDVLPHLLAEFGSGWLATVLDNVSGVGQGTMPNSMGHATDPDGWYWYDEEGSKHHSIGEAPTFPMHTAMITMLQEIDNIARAAFSGL